MRGGRHEVCSAGGEQAHPCSGCPGAGMIAVVNSASSCHGRGCVPVNRGLQGGHSTAALTSYSRASLMLDEPPRETGGAAGAPGPTCGLTAAATGGGTAAVAAGAATADVTPAELASAIAPIALATASDAARSGSSCNGRGGAGAREGGVRAGRPPQPTRLHEPAQQHVALGDGAVAQRSNARLPEERLQQWGALRVRGAARGEVGGGAPCTRRGCRSPGW